MPLKKNKLGHEDPKDTLRLLNEFGECLRGLISAHNNLCARVGHLESNFCAEKVRVQRLRAEMLMTATNVSATKDIDSLIDAAQQLMQFVETGDPKLSQKTRGALH